MTLSIVEDTFQFLFACLKLKDERATFWHILKEKVSNSDYLEKNTLYHFIENLDKLTTAKLLVGGLCLPFNSRIADPGGAHVKILTGMLILFFWGFEI